VYSYALALTVVEYQTAILRGDLAAAEAMLPNIPSDQRNRIARFLEAQGGFICNETKISGVKSDCRRPQGARSVRVD
jgi:hypothetical protein